MRVLLAAALGCAALAGCAADAWLPSGASEPARAGAAELAVTRDDASLPARCRPRALALRIGRFLDAVNSGDSRAARFMAPSGGWYSVSEGDARHFVAYDRAKLTAYFARRHAQRERMRLLELAVGFANGLGQIEFRLDRRAADLRRLGVAGTIAIGKGAVRCSTGQVVVWGMGMPTGRGPHRGYGGPCPRPERPAAIVACARPWR